MTKQHTQVNFRIPVKLKKQIDDVVAQKDEGSITEEVVNRLQLSFDLTKADGYNIGYRDATAHMTFAMTAALQKKGIKISDIQNIMNNVMLNFDKNA